MQSDADVKTAFEFLKTLSYYEGTGVLAVRSASHKSLSDT